MLKPLIGENAGKIWQTLREQGPLNLTNLRKHTRLDDRQLFLSLGWLARENKVRFDEVDGHIALSLV